MLLTKRLIWQNLEKHAQNIHYKTAIAVEKSHVVTTDLITLDYSHQRMDDTALNLLTELAKDCKVKESFAQLKSGLPVNHVYPALHTALRHFSSEPILVNGTNIIKDVHSVHARMRVIVEQIRAGEWLGYTGQPVTDIVNLGIGGSMLGPQFCMDALADHATKTLKFHFISEFDKAAFQRIINLLNPETTLFIASSKSFTTSETLMNVNRVLAWGNYNEFHPQHFIAVTAYPEKAKALGFQQILPFWPWVGGRYSVCSAINLITCIAIGFDAFIELLEGAAFMDNHFLEADILENLPIMLALSGIWNNNNLKIHTLLILTYAQSLHLFVPYLQQLEMESNGKSIDKQGCDVNYATAPIIWGGSANQAQHSYFQLLSQGTHRICADLISLKSLDQHLVEQHRDALHCGVRDDNVSPHIPCNHLQLVDDSPRALGALIALYEHKVFVQSVIWNINPFDQPGIERMKQKMEQFMPRLPIAFSS